ncbi:MAG: Holliday junction resolvase RuvX [Bacilli bacterium]|nr:Holliday junction resolvase RuvX [Bacilli bacterium]
MRILGLDLGSRTLGIAVSDPLAIIAQGVENFRFKDESYEVALSKVGDMLEKYSCEKVVLGLPLHMNGDLGEKAELAINFKKMIENEFNVKVFLIDERWTTKQATRSLLEADLSRNKRKSVIDKMSAVVILQTFLDQQKGGIK